MGKSTVITIAALVILFAGYMLVSYVVPVDMGERVASIYIHSGDSFQKVADSILSAEVISNGSLLHLAARWRGIDKKLTPGRYDFTGQNSIRSVLTKLEKADFVNIRVTVYEGAPIWKVASILAERMEVDSAEIVRLNSDSAFLAELGVPSLEGYLFPETYFFPWGTGSRRILSDMVNMFRLKTDPVWPDSLPHGLSRDEVVVLASIVEAEAMLTDEMPTIASVYLNRIERSMKLDADPTVIYALGGLDRPLLRADLRIVNPYNTYRNRGLPPTPINSPGLAAIEAVLEPAETDFLYFVADGTGYHRFSRTNAEHNRARREIKRSRSN